MRVCRYIIFGWILFISLLLSVDAQERVNSNIVRLDSTSIYYFHNTIDSADFPLFYPYDSTLSGIEKSNPSWRNAVYADLGNVGQAQKNLLFDYGQASGFRFKEVPYYSYIQNATNPTFYRSLRPYSEVYYRLGAKKEQAVGLDFSGNLYRGLTLGLSFDLDYCPGSYPNQKSTGSDLILSLRYFTPDYRYGVIGAFSHYKIKASENGGLAADSIFEQQLQRPEATPVNLTSGETTIRNYGFEITQYFNITKPSVPARRTDGFDYVPPPDSTEELSAGMPDMDSIRHRYERKDAYDGPERRKFNWGRLGWRMKTTSLAWRYANPSLGYNIQNPETNFFPNYYQDSTRTADSTRFFMFENTFSYSNANLTPRSQANQFRYYLALKYQYVGINSMSTDSVRTAFFYNQLVPKVQILTRLFNSFELRATADYVLTGYNKDDFSIFGSLSNTFGKGANPLKFQVEAMAALQMPDWFYSYYNGNHYRWDTTWAKVNYYVLGASISNKWFDLSGNYFLLSNYVYLNDQALPQSAEAIQNVLRLSLRSKVQLGKHWVMDNFLAYQETFGSDAIRLPKVVYNGTFYFGFHLFKKALLVMPGLSFFYNTAYQADAYTPALNSFYLQNKQEIGNYLYADVFLNLKIKRARIFVKYRHFDNILLKNTAMGYQYYMVPHYPQMGSGFYAGVSWRFID